MVCEMSNSNYDIGLLNEIKYFISCMTSTRTHGELGNAAFSLNYLLNIDKIVIDIVSRILILLYGLY